MACCTDYDGCDVYGARVLFLCTAQPERNQFRRLTMLQSMATHMNTWQYSLDKVGYKNEDMKFRQDAIALWDPKGLGGRE